MANTAGPAISSSTLDPRRKKLLFRAWHRGIKEMDIVLGNFADHRLGLMGNEELDIFENLMNVPDPELFKWISGVKPIPENYRSKVLDAIIEFHTS